MIDRPRRCPICSSRARAVGAKNGYEIARCIACAHGFVVTPPSSEDLASHYEYERGIPEVGRFVYPILASVIDGFKSYRSTNRLLDVGFGAGAMLRVAAEHRWSTYGIEISRTAVQAAQGAGIDAELTEGDFLDHPYEPHSFDVVIFDGIVANLPDPRSFFSRAHEVLRVGGLLYATTPHGRGASGRVLGTRWSAWAPPEHLHLFSTRSIAIVAEQAGFAHATTYTRGVNPYELLKILRRPASTPRSIEVNAALLRTRSGRTLKRLANAVLRATGLGDQLYLEAIA